MSHFTVLFCFSLSHSTNVYYHIDPLIMLDDINKAAQLVSNQPVCMTSCWLASFVTNQWEKKNQRTRISPLVLTKWSSVYCVVQMQSTPKTFF